MQYDYHFVTFDCGCKIRWGDFQPKNPKVGNKSYCRHHQSEVKIVEVESHSLDIEEEEIESQ